MKTKSPPKLIRAQKRCLIAKDVLAQLALPISSKKRRIIPIQGLYINPTQTQSLKIVPKALNRPFKAAPNPLNLSMNFQGENAKTICRAFTKCEACAVGSMFLMALDRFNKLKIGPHHKGQLNDLNSENLYKFLQRYFTRKQLQKIDDFFELYSDGEAQDALTLICRNIIQNKGTFKP